MSPLFLNFWIVGGLLAAATVVGRRPWVAAPVLALAAVVIGLARGFLVPMDLLHLPAWSGLTRECAALLAWALWAGAARMAPAPWLPGPPVVSAGLAGALFGEISGAALVASGQTDRRAAASLALAAAAGALLGRVGDPVLLALGDRVSALWFAPLGLVLLALAARGAPTQPVAEGDRRVTALGLAVAVGAALFPAFAWAIVLAGAVALLAWGLARKAPVAPALQSLSWVLGSAALVLVAVSAGLVDFAAEGMQDGVAFLGPAPPALLAACGALGAAFMDGPATALFAAGFLDRAMDMTFLGYEVPIAIGAAVGGLGPLVAVGALREGWRRWLLGVLIAVAYAAVAGHWISTD